MDTHDPWSILAEQGIHFRPVTAYPQAWEYALSVFATIWYGPYISREEALRAALRHLFALAQSGSSTIASATVTTITTGPSDGCAEQLNILRRQLRALELARASQGVASDPILEPQIADLVGQIKQIEQRMAKSDEES